MQFILGCTDGHTYTSDYISDIKIQRMIDNNEIATRGVNFPLRNVNDVVKYFSTTFSNEFPKHQFKTVTITIKGRERAFKIEHIIWWEILTDAPSRPVL